MNPALESVLKTPNARELLLALQGVLGKEVCQWRC
jgi:hypothetical protein